MVINVQKKKKLFLIIPPFFEEKEKKELKWTTVKLSEIRDKQNRLEAGVYDIEGKKARNIIASSNFKSKSIGGNNGLANIYHRPRFKRIFVNKSEYPIFQPSQITEILPKPNDYISDKTKTNIDKLRVLKNQILMTCSGTIGRITLVSKTLENKIFSHDVLRIKTYSIEDAGYLYAFFLTKTGQKLLTTNNYGAVIQHIEPDHLQEILIPDPPEELKKKIHEKIIKSYDLRDESNELIDKAEKLLIQELKLPPIEDFRPKYYKQNGELKTFNVKMSALNYRFDGSFHIPLVDNIINHLKNNSEEITTLGDSRISERIVLPGRFKRVYVEDGQGIKFIGGKELFQLNPKTEKYLSISKFSNKIKKELLIQENELIFPTRGSIGNVILSPQHFRNWSISDNLIKLTPASIENIGYIFSFLNSDYGKILIKRFIYGGVVDAIEPIHLSKVLIPLLKNQEIQKEINYLVLRANELRYEAYKLEQEAIKIVNEEVIIS